MHGDFSDPGFDRVEGMFDLLYMVGCLAFDPLISVLGVRRWFSQMEGKIVGMHRWGEELDRGEREVGGGRGF